MNHDLRERPRGVCQILQITRLQLRERAHGVCQILLIMYHQFRERAHGVWCLPDSADCGPQFRTRLRGVC